MAGHLLQITGLPKSKKNKKIGRARVGVVGESTSRRNFVNCSILKNLKDASNCAYSKALKEISKIKKNRVDLGVLIFCYVNFQDC